MVRKMLDYIFVAIGSAAVILFIITIALIVIGVQKNAHRLECDGTIVEFYENSAETRLDSYESKAISPIVEYEVSGQKYKLIGNFYSTNMKVGQKVKVLFDTKDPSIASLKSASIFAPLITGGIAVIMLIPPIVYFVLKNKGYI